MFGKDKVSHFVYVDNLDILSSRLGVVDSALQSATWMFDAAGLYTHERELQSSEATALGCLLDGRRAITRMTPERYWRVRKGLEFAFKCRRLPGSVWQVILGHLTFVALLRRDTLSIFSSVYAFIEKNLHSAEPLWPTARKELETFRGMMMMMSSAWTGGWSPLVLSTDASEFAYGVAGSFWPEPLVAQVGRVLERRCFRRMVSTQARSHFDIQHCLLAFDDRGEPNTSQSDGAS